VFTISNLQNSNLQNLNLQFTTSKGNGVKFFKADRLLDIKAYKKRGGQKATGYKGQHKLREGQMAELHTRLLRPSESGRGSQKAENVTRLIRLTKIVGGIKANCKKIANFFINLFQFTRNSSQIT
jgi:hypothetical protein